MINLRKGNEPQSLQLNSEAWTDRLIEVTNSDGTPTATELNRYNQPDVKAALLTETNEKRAYCESKFRHVEPGDIEHITPKRNGPEWRFRWRNLTIACSNCNTAKGTHEGLLDPYEDNVNEHLYIAGPMILGAHNSEKGQFSETVLQLSRRDLLDKRVDRLKNLHRLFCQAQSFVNPECREALLVDLRDQETLDNQEYAAVSRAFVNELVSRGLIPAA